MIQDSDPPGRDDPPSGLPPRPRPDEPRPDESRSDEPGLFEQVNERSRNPSAVEPPLRDPFRDVPAAEPEIHHEKETAPLRDFVQNYRAEARVEEPVRAPEPTRSPSPAPEVTPPPPPRSVSAEKGGWFRRKAAAPPPPPPPPPPGNKGKKPMSRSERSRSPFIAGANAALTILIFALLGLAVTVHYGIRAFNAPGPLQAQTDLAVPKGAGPRDIAERLEQAGAITNTTLFVVGTQASGNRGKLKAGEYRIPAQASMREIIGMMAEGNVVEHTVTIPEGLTSRQIVNRLLAESILSGSVREVPPEGTLLPETYHVTRGTDRESMLLRMAAAQKKLLDEVWAKRDTAVPVKSPQELVTLASIVEKETGIASERPRVASVFVNRLNKKMRLQSDPTIIYGLVQGTGTLGRPILRSEIDRPTPYNTYTIPGLPPGPIANPGRASMEAVANPAKTKDLYFVADGSGGHAFAESLVEHNNNVIRWRRADRAADNDRAPTDVPAAGGTPAAPSSDLPPPSVLPAKPRTVAPVPVN